MCLLCWSRVETLSEISSAGKNLTGNSTIPVKEPTNSQLGLWAYVAEGKGLWVATECV